MPGIESNTILSMFHKDQERSSSQLRLNGIESMLSMKVGSGSESRAIRSALAKLTVLVPPGQPKILRQSPGQKGKTDLELDLAEEDLVLEVAEGEVLELACISEGGRPAGEITWRDEEGEQVY